MHGFFQHKTGMPAFIVTLATLYALLGWRVDFRVDFRLPTSSRSGSTNSAAEG